MPTKPSPINFYQKISNSSSSRSSTTQSESHRLPSSRTSCRSPKNISITVLQTSRSLSFWSSMTGRNRNRCSLILSRAIASLKKRIRHWGVLIYWFLRIKYRTINLCPLILWNLSVLSFRIHLLPKCQVRYKRSKGKLLKIWFWCGKVFLR